MLMYKSNVVGLNLFNHKLTTLLSSNLFDVNRCRIHENDLYIMYEDIYQHNRSIFRKSILTDLTNP